VLRGKNINKKVKRESKKNKKRERRQERDDRVHSVGEQAGAGPGFQVL
jgi:hypothetical protein